MQFSQSSFHRIIHLDGAEHCLRALQKTLRRRESSWKKQRLRHGGKDVKTMLDCPASRA